MYKLQNYYICFLDYEFDHNEMMMIISQLKIALKN